MSAVRAFITVGPALFWLLLFAPPMFQAPPAVYTGVNLIQTPALIHPNTVQVDRDSPAYRAGLRTGDVLGCLSAVITHSSSIRQRDFARATCRER
jgi:predicted metalloprotease with PDZ domain